MRNPFILRKPSKKKLVYPFPVSVGMRGINSKATKAFVRVSAIDRKDLKEVEKLTRAASKTADPAANGYLAFRGEMQDYLHALASSSDYFSKPYSSKTKSIREILEKAGIQVEKPIQDLKNGTALFARTKWKDVLAILQERVHRRPAFYQKLINSTINLLIQIHQQNVAHNHLHRRNIVFDKNGNPELIDLSQAEKYNKPPATKKEFLRRYAMDIRAITQIVGNLTSCINPDGEYNYLYFTEQILREYQKKLSIFGATAIEIMQFRR